MIKAKICGITTKDAMMAAIANHADFIGLVFFAHSPRNIDIVMAQALFVAARAIAPSVQMVAVTVNPDDETLRQIRNIGIEWLQIHKIPSPARHDEIRAMGFKTIIAFGIAQHSDLEQITPYDGIADYILFDAKAPANAANEGGFGMAFDWEILKGFRAKSPWILSGGLSPENVKVAIAATNADFVDVSSGIESALGIKDNAKIEKFLQAVKGQNSKGLYCE